MTEKLDDKSFDEEVESKCIKEEKTPGWYIKARYVLAFMGFLGMFNLYSLRTNLSVAIVAMVNSTEELENGSDTCPDKGSGPISNAESSGVFDWNSNQQGFLLGSYFYGYIFSNIPGAWLAKRIGFKQVLGVAMLISSVITACSPIVAYTSFELFVALRILLGFFQGVSSPTMLCAWSNWAPPLQRSIFVSVALSGSSFGTFVTLPLAGLIADRLGWEAVFYFTGGAAFVWSIVWFAIIHNSPEKHPRISEQEKNYIINSIGLLEKKKNKFIFIGAVWVISEIYRGELMNNLNIDGPFAGSRQEMRSKNTVKVRTPWLSMLTSLPLLSIVFGHFASNWGNYTLLTMLPTYLATILKFDLSASGALSAVPYILQWCFTVGGGFITDLVRKHQLLSTTVIRKINTFLGLGIPALFIILAGYIGCNAAAAIAFFSLSVAFNALTVPGCKASTLDIAPKYGGITYGISNTVANISGFLSPQVVGILLLDGNNLGQWQLVFWISAGVYLVGAIVYLIFGSSEEQPWAGGKIVKSYDNNETHRTTRGTSF